ncbi:MAG: 3-hydroxyacyl-CoA dehydrogenase family protein [Desulfobacteraceae bacterium]|nr:MAG: 3-hydroxyacyl-CoA dehydrogenase family protein [Desulfobacteraceae bacterium]
MSPAPEKILIVGAGTMGHSLALLFAMSGFSVALVDREENAVNKALELIASAAGTLVESGMAGTEQIREWNRLIHTSTDLKKAAEDSFLAIETVDETPSIKKEVFTLLDRWCPQHTILSSNTSALNIFDIVETGRPERVVITHFFAPPHIIPLVEIVPGPLTDPHAVSEVVRIMEIAGKEPLVLREYIPGFIVNRIQRAIAREAFSLVDRGAASIEEIDRAVKSSLGIRLPVVGVLQTYDFTGLDVYYKINKETPISAPAAPTSPPEIVRKKVEEGSFGVKTGKGLYDYGGRKTGDIMKRRDLRYMEVLKALRKDRSPI